MQFDNVQHLLESISPAYYVEYQEPFLFVWNGSATLRIFVAMEDTAQETDIRTIYDAEVSDIQTAISEYMVEYHAEEAEYN